MVTSSGRGLAWGLLTLQLHLFLMPPLLSALYARSGPSRSQTLALADAAPGHPDVLYADPTSIQPD